MLSSATKHTAPTHSATESLRVTPDTDGLKRSYPESRDGMDSVDVGGNSDFAGREKDALIPLLIPGIFPQVGQISSTTTAVEILQSGNEGGSESHWAEDRRYAIDAISNISSSSSEEQVLYLGVWRITISRETSDEVQPAGEVTNSTISAGDTNKRKGREHVRTLQTVRSLLDGEFSYHLSIPEYCQFLAVRPTAQSTSSSSSSGVKKEQVSKELSMHYYLVSYYAVTSYHH